MDWGTRNDDTRYAGGGGVDEERLDGRATCARGCTGGLSWDARELRELRRTGPHRGVDSGNVALNPIEEPLSVEPSALPADGVPLPLPPALTDVEAVICGVFGDYCLDALAVARCESGPDYYAPGATYHTGTFQLAFRYHADKFAAYGWDAWATGDDVYRNSVVAYEIFAARGYSWLGTSGWPRCGLLAGY